MIKDGADGYTISTLIGPVERQSLDKPVDARDRERHAMPCTRRCVVQLYAESAILLGVGA